MQAPQSPLWHGTTILTVRKGGVVAIGGGEMPAKYIEAGMPKDIQSVLFPMDYAWSTENRERILEKWQAEIER